MKALYLAGLAYAMFAAGRAAGEKSDRNAVHILDAGAPGGVQMTLLRYRGRCYLVAALPSQLHAAAQDDPDGFDEQLQVASEEVIPLDDCTLTTLSAAISSVAP